jgi:hypothetical protein
MNRPYLPTPPRPGKWQVFLSAAYHALHFFLTAGAFFFLLMFGLFGLAVALEKGLGEQALPTVLWVAAFVMLSGLAVAHGISKARQ